MTRAICVRSNGESMVNWEEWDNVTLQKAVNINKLLVIHRGYCYCCYGGILMSLRHSFVWSQTLNCRSSKLAGSTRQRNLNPSSTARSCLRFIFECSAATAMAFRTVVDLAVVDTVPPGSTYLRTQMLQDIVAQEEVNAHCTHGEPDHEFWNLSLNLLSQQTGWGPPMPAVLLPDVEVWYCRPSFLAATTQYKPSGLALTLTNKCC